MSENENIPKIFYVRDGFNNESWHYAHSESSAVTAHKVHWFGRSGATKELKQDPKVAEATSFFGAVCMDEACLNHTGVPKNLILRLEEGRRVTGSVTEGQPHAIPSPKQKLH